MKQTAKYLLLFLLLATIACTDGEAQRFTKNVITLQIISPKDTFILGQPMVFIVRLTNVSNGDIFIPDTFSTTSNIFPADMLRDSVGAGFYADLEPRPQWQSKSLEKRKLVSPKRFTQLKSLTSKDFIVDISKEIANFNKLIKEEIEMTHGNLENEDELPVKSNKFYQLKINYNNVWFATDKRLQMHLQATSQQITFFLSQ